MLLPPSPHDRDAGTYKQDEVTYKRDADMGNTALMYNTADDASDATRFATEAAKLAVENLEQAMAV